MPEGNAFPTILPRAKQSHPLSGLLGENGPPASGPLARRQAVTKLKPAQALQPGNDGLAEQVAAGTCDVGPVGRP